MGKKQPERMCDYQRMRGQFFNGGGARPCMTCKRCIVDYESLERVKAWNRATDQGANPKR